MRGLFKCLQSSELFGQNTCFWSRLQVWFGHLFPVILTTSCNALTNSFCLEICKSSSINICHRNFFSNHHFVLSIYMGQKHEGAKISQFSSTRYPDNWKFTFNNLFLNSCHGRIRLCLRIVKVALSSFHIKVCLVTILKVLKE